MGKTIRVLFVFAFFCSGLAFSESGSSNRKFYGQVGLGVWGNNLSERLAASSEYSSEVSKLSGLFSLGLGMNLGKQWTLDLPLLAVVPWRSNKDGSSGKTYSFYNNLVLGRALGKNFWMGVGPGLQWTVIKSAGESFTLNNGTGTSTFYTPEGTVYSKIFTVNLSTRFAFSPRIYTELDFSVGNVLSSLKRRYTAWFILGIKI